MASLETAFVDVRSLESLAAQDTPAHRLDPRAKLLATLWLIVLCVSFERHVLSALVPFVLFPVLLGTAGRTPWRPIARKVALASPFALMLAAPNVLLDGSTLLVAGLQVSGGWLTLGSVLLRFVLTVSTTLVLLAVTPIHALGEGLLRLGAPRAFVVQLLLLVRYLYVIGAEASRMARARALRSAGRSGGGLRVFGSLVGQLLLRALDRTGRLHRAMVCRGFTGRLPAPRALAWRATDSLFLLGCALGLGCARLWDVPEWLGRTALELGR